MEGETILDTAIDLYVYAAKYRLFLADLSNIPVAPLDQTAPRPFSDHDANFERLIAQANFSHRGLSFPAEVESLSTQFEELCQAAENGLALSERQARADGFASSAERLVSIVASMEKRATTEFIRLERGLDDAH